MVALPRRVSLILLALGAIPNGLTAQWALGVDTGVFSRYHWRGLTRRNGAVWQTDAFVARRIGSTFLTAGAWTSIELARADPRIGESIGLGHWIGEIDGWVEWGYFCPCTTLEVGVGYTRYTFPRESGAAALGSTVFETGELYARMVARVLGFLTPRAAVWYDPEETDGAYFEGGLALDIRGLPALVPVLRFGGLAGFSFGQALDSLAPARPAYFADDGLTHLDFYTQVQLSIGIAGVPFYVLPAVHLQLNKDERVKVTGRGGTPAGHTWWVGVTFSLQALP
jgi:hypothetical protein